MEFDESQDKKIDERKLKYGKRTICVSKYVYKGGDPKIQIIRTYQNKEGDEKFAKLGRMNMEEAKQVSFAIQELIN